VGNINSLLQIDSRLLSIPFRIAVAIGSLWIIGTSPRLRTDALRRAMLIIWFCYVVRLVHDWVFTVLPSADYALQFFLAASVLPALGLMKSQAYDQRRFAYFGFAVASAGSIISLLATRFGGGEVRDLTEATGRLSLTALDPTTLGHLAVSAMFCGLALWATAKPRGRVILSCVFPLLIICLISTGSKGPALILAVCTGLLALRRGAALRFAALALPFLLLLLISDSNPLASRLAASEDDQSTVDRIVLLNDSLKQIEDAPLMGSAFVELNSEFYPHNVFVEAPMALGIPLGLVFIGMALFGAVRAWRELKGDNYLLGLLYFQGILAAALAGALFAATLFWIVLAILPIRVKLANRVRELGVRIPRAASQGIS
jgi:hypothetical protein